MAGHEHARRWLQFYANIGRAPNTITAYGRAVEDHLRFLSSAGTDPLVAGLDVVAAWIGDMLSRPNPRGAVLVHMDSGAGLANATVQQRIVAVRSFYEFIVEDGLRERNPVRRGQSGRRGKRPKQGLVRRVEQAPWIPTDAQWQQIMRAAAAEPVRNRLMIALAYASTRYYGEILQRTLSAAYRKADYFTRNVRTIQVLVDRESILTGATADGQPWKYYDLGAGYCSYDFFAKCPHRLACAKCSFYLPKQSNAGQLLAVKDGINQMLEQLDRPHRRRTRRPRNRPGGYHRHRRTAGGHPDAGRADTSLPRCRADVHPSRPATGPAGQRDRRR